MLIRRAAWVVGFACAALVGAVAPGAALAQSIADPGFLEQFAATNRFRQGNPTAITLTPEGDAVLFLRSGPRSFVNDLYEFDCATGKERVLLTAEGILKGAEEKLTPEELARRERQRSTARGIAGFSLSDDGTKILVPLSGRLFVIDRKSGATRELKSEHSAKFPIDPRFSPDGAKIATVRDGDLYVIDIGEGAPAEGRERRLTTKTSDTVTNGLAEFVAQEEMDRHRGYWWSPDSAMIAFQQTDTAGMETFAIADPVDPGKPVRTWPYPRAGGKNAAVRLGILNLKSGATEGGLPGTPDPVWVQWDAEEFPYLATVKWEENAPLWIRVQNRGQTEQRGYEVDIEDGEASLTGVFEDMTWINIAQSSPRWFGERDRMVSLVEGTGSVDDADAGAHVEGNAQCGPSTYAGDNWYLRIGRSHGTFGLESALLRGAIVGGSNAGDVFLSGSADPTQSHVYRVARDLHRLERITPEIGIHTAYFAKNSDVWVDAVSKPDGSRDWTVRTFIEDDGTDWSCPDDVVPTGVLGQLSSVSEKPAFPLNMEVTEVSTTDPADGLDHLGFKKGEPITYKALLIRPRNFEKGKKYPVINSVYGGPHAQTVTQAGAGQWLNQWYADHGFIVVSIDGRGTPSRGRAWERAIKGDLIKVPLLDQVAALKALGEKYPELDMDRVGIYGWSFGGYFSAMGVMREPGVFKCGVAGAPVADWRDYDTHYTERYMGMPDENKAGYDAASVLTYCKDLTRPLLIIHGTADDNVYFMHALKMSDALFKAGKKHDFLALAGFTHVVPDPVVVKNLYGRVIGFFEENLK